MNKQQLPLWFITYQPLHKFSLQTYAREANTLALQAFSLEPHTLQKGFS